MKLKTITKNNAYEISTIQIVGNIYETAIFEVSKCKKSNKFLKPKHYEVNYNEKISSWNYSGKLKALYYHLICVLFMNLVDVDVKEKIQSYEHKIKGVKK